MKKILIAVFVLMMMSGVCFADELTDLKAKAYEILVMSQNLQRQLVQVETKIIELSKQKKEVTEPVKE